MLIIKKAVENFASDRQGHTPEAIVIHLTNAPIQIAYEKCLSPHMKVSYHYIVSNQGQVWQLVDERATAWHAPGVLSPQWKLLKPNLNPNLYTIGVAIESEAGQRLPQNISTTIKELIEKICERWGIEPGPDTVVTAGELNKNIRPEYKALSIQIAKLFTSQSESIDVNKVSETLAQLEKLKSSISNLELRNAALEKQLTSQPLPNLSESELKEVLAQNTKLAEEIYLLQQELGIQEQQKKHLLGRIDSYKRQTSLDMFSIKELLKAIVKRIFK